MKFASSRRSFLGVSLSSLAMLKFNSSFATEISPSQPTGPVYGRIDSRGLQAGSPDQPSYGEVVLLNGRSVRVRNDAGQKILPGKSVWLLPAENGTLAILYAEI